MIEIHYLAVIDENQIHTDVSGHKELLHRDRISRILPLEGRVILEISNVPDRSFVIANKYEDLKELLEYKL